MYRGAESAHETPLDGGSRDYMGTGEMQGGLLSSREPPLRLSREEGLCNLPQQAPVQ